ncbi:MAG: putative RND superfamily exporter protein [Polyangiales bacterium]|jgi:predicted RND superfamily exporter protein
MSKKVKLSDVVARRFAGLSLGASAGIVLAALALSAVGIFEFARLASVDSRVETLLPHDTPTRATLDEARTRYPAASPLYLVVQSSDPVTNRRIADEMKSILDENEEVLWSVSRRDPSFFLDRRLLYVPTPALQTLADEVSLFVEWHRCEANPLCVSLEDEPDAPSFAAAQTAFEEDSNAAPLFRLFGLDDLPSPDANDGTPGASSDDIGDLCNPEGTLCVVQAALRGDSSDLSYATETYNELNAALDRFREGGDRILDGPDDIRVHIRGRMRSLVHSQSTLKEDLVKTAGLSLSLVLLVLLIQFRGARALLVLLLPLMVGAGWTALFVAHVSPILNLISAATLAVLAGLGIDFGLHLLTHYSHVREEGAGVREAIEKTLRALLPSLSVAGLTTAGGFAAVSAGAFPGFQQMGLVAGMGIVLTLIAYLLVLPPTLLLLHRIRAEGRSLTRPWNAPGWLRKPFPRGVSKVIVGVGFALLCGGLFLSPKLALETDYRSLEPPSDESVNYGSAMHGTSASLVLLLADSPEELETAVTSLIERYPNGPYDNGRAWLMAPSMFIPEEPAERLAIIAGTRDEVDRLEGRLSEERAANLEEWRPLLAVDAPITSESVPMWARSVLSEADGRFGTVGILYASVDSRNTDDMEALGDQLNEWREAYPGVRFASFGALLGEVSSLVRQDAPQIAFIAALGLLLVTLLIGRSFKRSAFALAPVVLASATSVLLMVFGGLNVNLYNLLMFPVAFGIAVDGAVYLVWTLGPSKDGSEDAKGTSFEAFPVVGRAILASTLTTMGAFGSMLISQNPGLQSLGTLAIVTLGATLFANLLWLPALLSLSQKRD